MDFPVLPRLQPLLRQNFVHLHQKPKKEELKCRKTNKKLNLTVSIPKETKDDEKMEQTTLKEFMEISKKKEAEKKRKMKSTRLLKTETKILKIIQEQQQ